MHAERQQLAAKARALRVRQQLYLGIHSFFQQRGFLHIETPIRIEAPAPEQHIDALPSGTLFLRTSPELHMKRLLAAGYNKIYQMGPCFRRDEAGYLHQPEFTMLEWYRTDADSDDILSDTRHLLRHLCHLVHGTASLPYDDRHINMDSAWAEYKVSELFLEHAGWDPCSHFDADRFDMDLVEKIEPVLAGENVPVILSDYPREQCALAVIDRERGVALRWELYIAGIELANAYTELTDAEEQRNRFAATRLSRQKKGCTIYPQDDRFLEALEFIERAGGIALGLDRLCMLFTDSRDIRDVTAFPASF